MSDDVTKEARKQATFVGGGAGDAYGTHRAVEPRGALPQPAWRLDHDFTRIFPGEVLLAVETLNIDAASFTQMEKEGDPTTIVLRTVAERGKQHNPVTGSGGMLLGRVVQVAPSGRPAGEVLEVGARIATLVSLSLTPLRVDRIRAVRPASAQIDVDGEAVLFASGAYARLPPDLPDRLALAALDVAGAAPQVARLVKPGAVVVVLGAGGKSGILCVAEARRRGGPGARIVGLEASARAADELRGLGLCDAVVAADARDPVAVRAAVLGATGGAEADVTFSCVNVPDAELGAILATRDRGVVYFFAMSTSFTKAALGAEGVGKDVDLFIGNGYAHGHADHTLGMLREMPAVRALFQKRYAES
ncbi:MAG TPA: L-erythro-3,5-diaminohexanoate dehydrogenase [Polyangiaceae bacterium]|nr:L-erythro-3,5-diaminohexanoate dehydrogenase [Polyangiaceae bacterium]